MHALMLHPQAGHVTGDRLWRMPLYGQYIKQIQDRVLTSAMLEQEEGMPQE